MLDKGASTTCFLAAGWVVAMFAPGLDRVPLKTQTPVPAARVNANKACAVAATWVAAGWVNNKAEVDLVLNAPEALVDDQTFERVMNDLMDCSKSYGLDDTIVNLSVIPNRNLRYSSSRLEG